VEVLVETGHRRIIPPPLAGEGRVGAPTFPSPACGGGQSGGLLLQ